MTLSTRPPLPPWLTRRRMIAGGVTIALILVGAWLWNTPLLGPQLQAQSTAAANNPPPTSQVAVAVAPTDASVASTATLPPTQPVAAAVTPTDDPTCGAGDSAPINIMVVGSDAVKDTYEEGRADAIRIFKVNYQASRITVLALPRDLWIPIPGLEAQNIYEGRINAAYAYGELYKLPGGGASELAATMEENFDLKIDHYVVVNFHAFARGVDAIGGVDITLSRDVDGRLQGMPYFKAGPQHWDGATALSFVRIRYPDNDFYRIERQSSLMLAIRRKVLSPEILPAAPDLIDTLRQAVLTDMTAAQLASLLCVVQHTPEEAIAITQVDGNMVSAWTTPGGARVLLPKKDEFAKLIEAFNAETTYPVIPR